MVVHLDYNVSSGPFLTMNFEFDLDHGPRPAPELDNSEPIYINIHLLFKLKSLISGNSTMMTPEYQCSDPAEIIKIGKQISSLIPLMKNSFFMKLLFSVFVFYAFTTLLSVLLIIFSIWL